MTCMTCYTRDRKVQSYMFEGGLLGEAPVIRQLCDRCKQTVVNFLVREPGSSVNITNLSSIAEDVVNNDFPTLEDELLFDDQQYWGDHLQQLLS